MCASEAPHKTCLDQRLNELDWLRVLAFGLLIFYHIGMLYVPSWGWHYKSSYLSENLENVMLISNQWRMGLLFLISGAASVFMIKKMGALRFWISRHPRLIWPLAFGIFFIVPPQLYIEIASSGRFAHTTYLEFWSSYFGLGEHVSDIRKQINEAGASPYTPNHLWYLYYIFVYSTILALIAPVFVFIPVKKKAMRLIANAPNWTFVVLPVLALFAANYFLLPNFPPTHALVDDWYNHARYFLCFSVGASLMFSLKHWRAFPQHRCSLTIGATLSYAAIVYNYNQNPIGTIELSQYLSPLVWACNAWLTLACVLAWSQQFLTKRNHIISYLNQSIYCHYIMHQTIIILVASVLVPRQLGPFLEPTAVVLLTLMSLGLSYELIRRIPFVRSAFGVNVMK